MEGCRNFIFGGIILLMRVTGPFQADRLNFSEDHRVQLKIQIGVKQVDA